MRHAPCEARVDVADRLPKLGVQLTKTSAQLIALSLQLMPPVERLFDAAAALQQRLRGVEIGCRPRQRGPAFDARQVLHQLGLAALAQVQVDGVEALAKRRDLGE
jgi:hypothetical protein